MKQPVLPRSSQLSQRSSHFSRGGTNSPGEAIISPGEAIISPASEPLLPVKQRFLPRRHDFSRRRNHFSRVGIISPGDASLWCLQIGPILEDWTNLERNLARHIVIWSFFIFAITKKELTPWQQDRNKVLGSG